MRTTKIAIKYCGGCNPDFDRKQAVEAMLARLGNAVDVVAPDDPEVEIIVAVEGCPVSCADLDAYQEKSVVVLSSLEDVDRFQPTGGDDAAR